MSLNLIGPLGYQAPTNNMLGRLAYSNEIPSDVPAVGGMTLAGFAKTLRAQFNTMGLFRGIDSTVFSAAETLGYWTLHDGGHAAYVLVATSNTASYVDDGGSTIIANDGSVWQLIRPTSAVDVRNFGAIPNSNGQYTSGMDVTSYVVKADAFAYASGVSLSFPTGTGGQGYRFGGTTTTQLYSRGLKGDLLWTSGVGGTIFYWNPAITLNTTTAINTPTLSTNNNLACIRMMSVSSAVDYICIIGAVNYNLATLVEDGFWPANTPLATNPNYSNLGIGLVGFEWAGGSTGIMSGCAGKGLKHVVNLANNLGHIYFINCSFAGYVSVMVTDNNYDYYVFLGGISGVLAGWAGWDSGYVGGISCRYERCHMGFCPMPIMHFHDDTTLGNGGTSSYGYDVMKSMCSFEQIGEAAIFGGSEGEDSFWADNTETGYMSSNIAGSVGSTWAFILPATFAPTAGTQLFHFRFGRLVGFQAMRGGYGNDNYYDATNSAGTTATRGKIVYATQLGGYYGQYCLGYNPFMWSVVGGYQNVQIGDMTAATYSGVTSKVNFVPRPESTLGAFPATTGDLRRAYGFAAAPNLLVNPEVAANYTVFTNGVVSVSRLSTLLASGELLESQITPAFRQELGTNPWITKVTSSVAPTSSTPTVNPGFILYTQGGNVSIPNELVSYGWFALTVSSAPHPQATVRHSARVAGANGALLCAEGIDIVPGQWARHQAQDYAGGPSGSANNVYSELDVTTTITFAGNEVTYFAGLMFNKGPLATYNPTSAGSYVNQGLGVYGPIYQTGNALVPSTVLASGFSQTIDITIGVSTLNVPAAGLAAGTVVLPKGTYQGQVATFCTIGAITALTVSGASGATVVGARTTLAQGQGSKMWWNIANATWYPSV